MEDVLTMCKKPLRAVRTAVYQWKVGRSPFFSRFPNQRASLLINSRALVSTKNQFIYFRIPKAANSAVVASLLAGESQMHRDAVEAIKTGGPKLSSLSAKQVDRIVNDYHLFTFVRNPITRIYSCYLDKIARSKPESRVVTMWLKRDNGAVVTFDEFLDFLEHDQNIYKDAHWARQTDLIPLGLSSLHLIGTVESFDRDFNKLVDLLGLAGRIPKRFAPHATGATEKLAELGSEQIQRIIRLYHDDFEKLKYPMNFDPANLARAA